MSNTDTSSAKQTLRRIFWNGPEGRPRTPWRLVLAVVVLLVAFVVVGIVSMAAMATGIVPETEFGMLVVGAIASVLVLPPAFYGIGRGIDRRPFSGYGVETGDHVTVDLGFGLALGGLLQAVIFAVGVGAGWYEITGFFVAEESFLSLFLMAIVLFIAVGVYEELLVRGWLLTNLAEGLRSRGPRFAVGLAFLLTSGLFGVLHYGNPGATAFSVLTITIAGIMLALGYVLTGTLAIPIGVHISWNLFQGSVFGFAVSGLSIPVTIVATEPTGPDSITGGEFGPEAGILGLLGLMVGIATILAWMHWYRGSIGIDSSVYTYQETVQPQEETDC